MRIFCNNKNTKIVTNNKYEIGTTKYVILHEYSMKIKFFANFTGKLEILFNKTASAQVISCEVCESFKKKFYTDHLEWLLSYQAFSGF